MATRVRPGTHEARVLLLIADDGPQCRHTIGRGFGRSTGDTLKALQHKGLIGFHGRPAVWHMTPAGVCEADRIDPLGVDEATT